MSAPHLRFSRLYLVLCCAIPALLAPVNAQVAGRNVNMVSGGSFPGGDPFLPSQSRDRPSVDSGWSRVLCAPRW